MLKKTLDIPDIRDIFEKKESILKVNILVTTQVG